MYRFFFISFLFCSWTGCQQPGSTGKDSLGGTYYANVQGGTVSMTIEAVNGNTYHGAIHDGNYIYNISGSNVEGELRGIATDSVQGIAFDIETNTGEDTVILMMTMTSPAPTKAFPLYFTKKKSTATHAGDQGNTPSGTDTPNAGQNGPALDPAVVGTWEKQENYSSGSGADFGAMSSSASMTFHANGTMSSGPSSVQVGGADFSGMTSDEQVQYLPGILWYTANSHLWLRITVQGKTEETNLGKYYVENGKMLITGNDGDKLLLYKMGAQ